MAGAGNRGGFLPDLSFFVRVAHHTVQRDSSIDSHNLHVVSIGRQTLIGHDALANPLTVKRNLFIDHRSRSWATAKAQNSPSALLRRRSGLKSARAAHQRRFVRGTLTAGSNIFRAT